MGYPLGSAYLRKTKKGPDFSVFSFGLHDFWEIGFFAMIFIDFDDFRNQNPNGRSAFVLVVGGFDHLCTIRLLLGEDIFRNCIKTVPKS